MKRRDTDGVIYRSSKLTVVDKETYTMWIKPENVVLFLLRDPLI